MRPPVDQNTSQLSPLESLPEEILLLIYYYTFAESCITVQIESSDPHLQIRCDHPRDCSMLPLASKFSQKNARQVYIQCTRIVFLIESSAKAGALQKKADNIAITEHRGLEKLHSWSYEESNSRWENMLKTLQRNT